MPMPAAAYFRLLLLTGALSLSGCSAWDYVWGDDESEDIEAEQAAQAAIKVKVPVQAVRSVEMGRTRDGFLITAYGTAPGLGYSAPALRARRDGAPGADGYIEYDFVAVEPPEGRVYPPGSTQIRSLRADLPVKLEQLQGALGLRVLSLGGGVQMDF